MAAFPLFSPTSNSTSFSRPDTAASFSFASRLSSRRPSATASVGATNPFGPLLYWDRPEGTVNEEDLEYVKNIRYYAHDLVQGDLRKAYGERKRTQSATDVTRGYLNALNAKFTSEVVLEYPEGGSRNDGQFSDMDMDKDHLRAAWAVRFLERCEQNGW